MASITIRRLDEKTKARPRSPAGQPSPPANVADLEDCGVKLVDPWKP